MKDKILMQIANGLSANVQKLTSPGLLEGKMGVAVFLYHYGRYSGKTSYFSLADHLIDEILDWISQSKKVSSAGLSGIKCGITHLIKERFINIEDESVSKWDNDLIRTLLNPTDEELKDDRMATVWRTFRSSLL